MIVVAVKEGENIERALKRFKRTKATALKHKLHKIPTNKC